MRTIDVTIPAVVLDTGPDTARGLAALRVLGRLGVAVFGVHDSPWAPAAQSRYLSGRLVVCPGPDHAERTRAGLVWLAHRIGRRAVLIPAGDAAAVFAGGRAASLRDWFLLPGPDGRCPTGPDVALASYLGLTGQPASRPAPAAPATWFAGDDMLPSGLMCLRRATRILCCPAGRRGSGRASGEAGHGPGPDARWGQHWDAEYRAGRGLPGMYPGATGRPALAGGRAGHG